MFAKGFPPIFYLVCSPSKLNYRGVKTIDVLTAGLLMLSGELPQMYTLLKL